MARARARRGDQGEEELMKNGLEKALVLRSSVVGVFWVVGASEEDAIDGWG